MSRIKAVTVSTAPMAVSVAYTIMLGSTQQSLLTPLTLPAPTIRATGWSPTLQGTAAGNDVFDPGTNPGGTATMIGGAGNEVFYVHGTNDVVVAKPGGVDTVITDYGWGVYTLPANVQNLVYDGTASYAQGWITLVGNALDNTIVAGNTGVELVAGAGQDTLVGGTGSDIFVIGAGGNETIIGFHAGDTVQLQNLGFSSFATVQAAMQQVGVNAVLGLGNGRTLTFVNQTVAGLGAAAFGFPAQASTSGASTTSAGTTGASTTGASTTSAGTTSASTTGASTTGSSTTVASTTGGSTTGASTAAAGSTATAGTGTTATPAGSTGIVTNPVIAQPTQTGQVVGFQLRNNSASAIGAHEVTFGEVFAAGQVPAGRSLVAIIDGQTVAVQMDVKTTNADGSVALAVITLLQPALAAQGVASGMLTLATPGTAPTPISLSTLTAANYQLTVSLSLHGGAVYTLDAATLLHQALLAGTVTTIRSGAQVTEAQFQVPISGSLRVVFDVSRFADGSTATTVSFNNDIALSASGGTATYDVSVSQNGVVALQQSNIVQYQYQTWNQTFYSNGAPQAQVIHDVAALEATGAVPNYDLSSGISAATLAAEASQLGGASYGILGAASVTQYMPTTGGRADIGPLPQWDAVWLMSQDPTAQSYALAQANAAGSVPWHFYDPTTGGDLSVAKYPTLWLDPRATPGSGYTGLTQPVSSNTGWTADAAHQPDLSYLAYLMTGDQTYLDQLNAQASWAVAEDWTAPRQNGLGLVANGQDQVREQAWNLREVDEAAYANPAGSAAKAYFSQLETNNWQWLVSQIPAWSATEGQAYGYLPGNYGQGGSIAPWEQDYFASTAVQAAEMGNQDALTFLKWEANFLVGRFLNAANGFNPRDGIAYNLTTATTAGTPLTTWAGIEQASQAAGQTNNSGWSQSNGDYAQLALQSLAGIITLTGSTSAIQAYGWLISSGAPELDSIAGTQFDIAPRLPDGQLLTADHIILSGDTTATRLVGSNSDQLIHAGSGNDTLVGGSGTNLLFAGSGNDVLLGGAGPDYLYGGAGTDTLSGGAGMNFMQAGSGADSFALTAADIATDLIAGFKLGTDHLVVAGASSAFVGQLLRGATQDAGGNAVLHLSSSHSVTLQGIGVGQLSTGMFM